MRANVGSTTCHLLTVCLRKATVISSRCHLMYQFEYTKVDVRLYVYLVPNEETKRACYERVGRQNSRTLRISTYNVLGVPSIATVHSLRARGDYSIGFRWAGGCSRGITIHYNPGIVFICSQSVQRHQGGEIAAYEWSRFARRCLKRTPHFLYLYGSATISCSLSAREVTQLAGEDLGNRTRG